MTKREYTVKVNGKIMKKKVTKARAKKAAKYLRELRGIWYVPKNLKVSVIKVVKKKTKKKKKKK